MSRGGRVYTPAETVNAEKAYITAVGEDPPVFDGPVSIELTFDNDGTLVKVTPAEGWVSPLRGDIDNYCKLALDGLQRAGVIMNDKQVVYMSAVKM